MSSFFRSLSPRFLPGAFALAAFALATISLRADEGNAETRAKLVASREARLAEMVDDLKRLSEQFEKRVDETVDMLASMADSTDSASKVQGVKTRAIELLKDGIVLNDQRKRSLEEERRIGKSGLSAEEATKMIAWIDQRMEKRKAQMLTLAKSLPIREEVERYLEKPKETSRWRRNEDEASYEINPEWRHNRKVSGLSDVERKELIEAVDKDILSLERSLAGIRESIGKAKSDAVKAILEEDSARVSASLETRRAQKTELENPVKPETKPVDGEELGWLLQEFDHTVADLREDVTRIRKLEDQVRAGRASINRLKATAE